MNTAPVLEEFRQQVEREFIECSAIAPSVYASTISVVSDLEIGADGEPTTPIHDALNWHYVRFGAQIKTTQHAALFLQEDSSVWQAKLSTPLVNKAKGKNRHYAAPTGNGSRAYLPPINDQTRRAIAQRYGLQVPPASESFWAWLQHHPEIPIIYTEGGKKALALLSRGYVAIALYGVNAGYCKLPGDTRALIPDVARFVVPGRPVTLVFDQDAESATRQRVTVALSRFGGLLAATGCDVGIAQWDGQQGKGIDDLIVGAGAGAAESAIANALPLEHWRIRQRLENSLTWSPSVRVNTASLEELDVASIPRTGIIGISSPKGTGKTKLQAKMVAGIEKLLSAGHRIALMRNLAGRLGVDYRSDIDKTPDGKFINQLGYTLRVGFCVEALLAIDPQQFEGCDLVVDEAVQVVRQLLTSSTCQRDGMRPALLARFAELVRAARRVILADADLDNATLYYFKQLRGDDCPIWLLQNDYQAAAPDVRFIDSPDASSIKAEFLNDARELPTGKVLFVATDSKGTTKELNKLLAKQCPDKRVLVINSDTSGGDAEKEFISTPDTVLERNEYDIIIASPSLGTGASIEAQGTIRRVYGIFTGGAGGDGDLAQALARVREPVERVVWCAKVGRNFNRISRSQNPLEVKGVLLSRTSTTVSITRSSLKADVISAIAAYDWQSDPNLNLYCHFAAEQNRAMRSLRTALLVRLRYEGHQVTVEKRDSDPALRLLLLETRQEIKRFDAETIANADDLTFAEVAFLEQLENRTPQQQKAIERYYFQDFYCLESVTVDDVLGDNGGRRRGELRSLEELLYPDVASDRTVNRLEKQASWNQGLCPWDVSGAALRRALREKIGLQDFLCSDKVWTKDDLATYGERARELALQIKTLLHFTITEGVGDTQIIHQLLRQMGVKVARCLKGSAHNGTRRHVYSLDLDAWNNSVSILERRHIKRLNLQKQDERIGSPLPGNTITSTGDPIFPDSPNTEEWTRPGAWEEVREMVADAQSDAETIEYLRSITPPEIWEMTTA